MSEPLERVLAGYLELRWQMNPVEATFAGIHHLDGQLPRYDAESIGQHVAALRSYASALEEAEAPLLADEIDRTAALHAVRADLLALERERRFARDPAFHLTQALEGIFVLLARESPDPVQRATALAQRLAALPGYLDTAAASLTTPVRLFIDTARTMIPGGLALLDSATSHPMLDESAVDPEELDAARLAAPEALRAFEDTLVALDERANDRFALGRDLFDRKLHTAHMIQQNADELMRFGEELRTQAAAAADALAAEIEPGATRQTLARSLRTTDAPVGSPLDEFRLAMQAARDFTIGHALMRVPDAPLTVEPTPDFLRSITPFAAYLGPGAFESDQTGTFFVTVADPAPAQSSHSRAEIRTTALHEGIPGHHLQIVTGNRLDRPVRRVIATPATREGWALYCESLLAELGFLGAPADRFFQAYHLLWRALRVVLDVSLHTRGMTVDAAATVLCDELGFEHPVAMAEVRRYCAYPTYQLCYAVGRREILALRDDARRQRGSDFSLAAFHDELLGYGALPAALARWGMGLA